MVKIVYVEFYFYLLCLFAPNMSAAVPTKGAAALPILPCLTFKQHNTGSICVAHKNELSLLGRTLDTLSGQLCIML